MLNRRPYVQGALILAFTLSVNAEPFTISVNELENKIKGGWLGKSMGVSIAGPTEFAAQGVMYTGPINFYPPVTESFKQDDLFKQQVYIAACDKYLNEPLGVFAATQAQYGESIGQGERCAGAWSNGYAYMNIKLKGIMPPYSGMWGGPGHQHDSVCEAIDWQIDCDWIGLTCPAMPMSAMRLNDSAGHSVAYADGLYGGYFVTGMISLAFKINDPHQLVKEALKLLPPRSDYHKIISDVVTFHDNNPTKTYQECWKAINDKWLHYRASPCIRGNYNILASFNGAFIAIGLMYGDGDILKSIEYSTRCGQDSDCNPANVGTILGVVQGYNALPQQWRSSLDTCLNKTYSNCFNTSMTYTQVLNSHIARAKKCIIQQRGALSGTTYSIQAEECVQPRLLEVYGADPIPNPDFKSTSTLHQHRPNTSNHVNALPQPVECFDIAGKRIVGIVPSGRLSIRYTPQLPGRVTKHLRMK